MGFENKPTLKSGLWTSHILPHFTVFPSSHGFVVSASRVQELMMICHRKGCMFPSPFFIATKEILSLFSVGPWEDPSIWCWTDFLYGADQTKQSLSLAVYVYLTGLKGFREITFGHATWCFCFVMSVWACVGVAIRETTLNRNIAEWENLKKNRWILEWTIDPTWYLTKNANHVYWNKLLFLKSYKI